MKVYVITENNEIKDEVFTSLVDVAPIIGRNPKHLQRVFKVADVYRTSTFTVQRCEVVKVKGRGRKSRF